MGHLLFVELSVDESCALLMALNQKTKHWSFLVPQIRHEAQEKGFGIRFLPLLRSAIHS